MKFNKTGVTNNANRKELVIENITVIAMPPTNSVLGPLPLAIGKNANTVVAVAAANGTHK